jgi:hypothetical protein
MSCEGTSDASKNCLEILEKAVDNLLSVLI